MILVVISNSVVIAEQWVPYIPQSRDVTLDYWKENGTSYVNTSIMFPNSGYNISDWGTPTIDDNNISVNALIWHWTGWSYPWVMTKYHTYNLENLSAGIYFIDFETWWYPVKNTTFIVPIMVPDDYPTIQEAINAANPRDTVSVRNGTYYEHVVVNKSISLIGENKENTIIDGSRNGTVISVTADYVSISGLTIQNGYHIPHITYGIKVGEWEDGCNNVTVHDNIISDNDMGIFLYYSSNSIVFDNLVFNNYRGIDTVLSNDNHIEGNSLFNNEVGVVIGSDANSNMIHNNEIYNNSFCGIWVGWSTHNKIVGNMLSYNNEAGIRLDASNHTNIIGNHLASNHRNGIVLFGSNSNTVTGNTLIQNEWDGIALWYSNSNSIYHNNFLDNTKQAGSYSGSINTWDYGYPSGGNYWSDHACIGNPSDGSQPYIIDANNIDHYPFQDPNGWLLHQLTVTSSPITEIPFMINDTSEITPYTDWLLEGSYTLEMPETYNEYVWSHWLEDGDTNRTKTITLSGDTTWTGVFALLGDLNGDNKVRVDDVLIGVVAFGSDPSHPRWNPMADLNRDGRVRVDDIVTIALRFGEGP